MVVCWSKRGRSLQRRGEALGGCSGGLCRWTTMVLGGDKEEGGKERRLTWCGERLVGPVVDWWYRRGWRRRRRVIVEPADMVGSWSGRGRSLQRRGKARGGCNGGLCHWTTAVLGGQRGKRKKEEAYLAWVETSWPCC